MTGCKKKRIAVLWIVVISYVEIIHERGEHIR